MQRDDVNDTTKHVTKTQASRKRSGTRQGVPGTKSCNWSRQLACATCGGGRSEAGHCFHLLFFLFWPRRLACAMHSLAIVITIVRSFGPGGLRAPCVAWPLLLPSFSLSLSLLRLLLLTHFGESPVCENLFPPIFWHN